MSMKEQTRKDDLRAFGQSSTQPPESSTFYNYLQYKINHKEQHGTPQIPLNPVHSKAGSQKGSSMPRKEVMPGMPVNSAQQINLGQVQLANNQTVNSWFVQRLKSILAGQIPAKEQMGAPMYSHPTQSKEIKRYTNDTIQHPAQQKHQQQQQQKSQSQGINIHTGPNTDMVELARLNDRQKSRDVPDQNRILIGASDGSNKMLNRYVSKDPGPSRSDQKTAINHSDLFNQPKQQYTSNVTHMPDVNNAKNRSSGFATEGKSRRTQNVTTGSSLQNQETHANTMPQSHLANRIGTVPAISSASATSQSTSIPFRKNGETQELSELSASYKGQQHDSLMNNGASLSTKVQSQPVKRPEINQKRINYMRQREFANYLLQDQSSTEHSQQQIQIVAPSQKPKDLNEAFEATFGGEKVSIKLSQDQDGNEGQRIVRLSSMGAKQAIEVQRSSGNEQTMGQRGLNDYNVQNLMQVHHRHVGAKTIQDPPGTDPQSQNNHKLLAVLKSGNNSYTMVGQAQTRSVTGDQFQDQARRDLKSQKVPSATGASNRFGIVMGSKKASAATGTELPASVVSAANQPSNASFAPHKVTNVDRATCESGQREQRNTSKQAEISISQKSSGHNTKQQQLTSKPGLGGTHRHSLEKLKEYETQLLQSQGGHPSLNVKSNREGAFEAQQQTTTTLQQQAQFEKPVKSPVHAEVTKNQTLMRHRGSRDGLTMSGNQSQGNQHHQVSTLNTTSQGLK